MFHHFNHHPNASPAPTTVLSFLSSAKSGVFTTLPIPSNPSPSTSSPPQILAMPRIITINTPSSLSSSLSSIKPGHRTALTSYYQRYPHWAMKPAGHATSPATLVPSPSMYHYAHAHDSNRSIVAITMSVEPRVPHTVDVNSVRSLSCVHRRCILRESGVNPTTMMTVAHLVPIKGHVIPLLHPHTTSQHLHQAFPVNSRARQPSCGARRGPFPSSSLAGELVIGLAIRLLLSLALGA